MFIRCECFWLRLIPFSCGSEDFFYVQSCILSEKRVAAVSDLLYRFGTSLSSSHISGLECRSMAVHILTASVVCHERCGIYQERTPLEAAVIRSGLALNVTFRAVLSTIGPAASDDRLAMVPVEIISELGRTTLDFVRDYAAFTLRRKEVLKRRYATTAYVYRNAMRHCGLGCVDHRQYCSTRVRAALSAIGEVDAHAQTLVRNVIEASSHCNKYVAGYPGDPLVRRHGPFLRVPSYAPVAFCDLAARLTLDPTYSQPYPPADTLDDCAVFHGLYEDLADVGGATMYRVVEFCHAVLEDDDTLAGLDFPNTVARLSHTDLYDAFRRGLPLGGLLAHHFGAVWLTYYYNWATSLGSVGVRLVLGMHGRWSDERDAELRAYSHRLPIVDLTHEEQTLLRPVMDWATAGFAIGAPASLLRSDEVFNEWTSLLQPVRGGALATPEVKAEHWVKTMRLLLFCVRSARIDYANRRGVVIRELLAEDAGRLCRYIAAKSVAGVGAERMLMTSRWFASVSHSYASPRYLGYRIYRLMTSYMCSYLEMIDMNPGYYDIVLFPTYPPLIPVGQTLSFLSYHREELSAIRSTFVSVAVVAALMNTFEKHLAVCLPGMDPAPAMRRLRMILEGGLVRNTPLSEVVKLVVNSFWMDVDPSLLDQSRRSFMQRTLNAVCRNSLPRARGRGGHDNWLSDHVVNDSVAGVRHFFIAHAMYDAPLPEHLPGRYMRFLPNVETLGAVRTLFGDSVFRMRKILVWTRRIYSDVFNVLMVQEPKAYVGIYERYIRAQGVEVPSYSVLPDIGNDDAAIDAVAPLAHRVHELVVMKLRQWLLRLNQCGDGGPVGVFGLDVPAAAEVPVAAAEEEEAVSTAGADVVMGAEEEAIVEGLAACVVHVEVDGDIAFLPSLDDFDDGWIERLGVAPDSDGAEPFFDFSVQTELPSGSGLGLV